MLPFLLLAIVVAYGYPLGNFTARDTLPTGQLGGGAAMRIRAHMAVTAFQMPASTDGPHGILCDQDVMRRPSQSLGLSLALSHVQRLDHQARIL